MKALVLAGGRGTRLRPITYTSAKQLVPLANRPILFSGLDAIAELGVREVGLIVGDTHEEIEAAVGDGSQWGFDVTFIRQDAPLGLAHTVLVAREFLGDEPFVMYLGDNLLLGGLAPFAAHFDADIHAALVLLAEVDDPRQFGVAELDRDGRLIRLVEKPAEPSSDLALVGVYFFGPAIHDAVRAIVPSPRGELEITDALQWLIDHGHRVDARRIADRWIDTGKLTDVLEANRVVLDRQEGGVRGTVDAASTVDPDVVIEADARIVGSVVRGPSIVGGGTVVTNASIGPYTSVGPNCRIEAASVTDSILLEGSSIVGVTVTDSLIGRQARVSGAAESAALHLHVGDHSDVVVPPSP